MTKLKILYVGCMDEWSGSRGRYEALVRLGHDVTTLDQRKPMMWFHHRNAFAVRFSFIPFIPMLKHYLLKQTAGKNFDLVWINHGAEVPPSVIKKWKKDGARVVHYSTDDPFGGRDGRKWLLVRRSAPYADAHIVVREPNVQEAKNAGFRHVLKVYMSYNPVQNDPPMELEEESNWASEVLFLGTWMPGRDEFLYELIKGGVPLTIRGQRWQFSPRWEQIKQYFKGGPLWGPDYARALRNAKINIGLVSEGNRDEYTTRSFEVPYVGSVLCAQNTPEHAKLFQHMEEAVLWNDAGECAQLCHALLSDDALRARIAVKGQDKVKRLKVSDDEVLSYLVETVLQIENE